MPKSGAAEVRHWLITVLGSYLGRADLGAIESPVVS
jgi:hypothetical protein